MLSEVNKVLAEMVVWDRIKCGSDPRKPHVPLVMTKRLYDATKARYPELLSRYEVCMRCRAEGVPIVRV